MEAKKQYFYEFGPFLLDPAERLLLRDGQSIALAPKVFDTLLVLLQNSGHLLDKDELLRSVWPNTFVEDGSLAKNVFLLRKVLENGQEGKEYIETVPKRGYRFVVSVKKIKIERNVSGTIDTGPIDQDFQLKDADLLQTDEERHPRPSLAARWWVLGGFVLLAFGTIGFVLMRRGGTDPTPPKIRSLAVLPLQNLSGDPAQEYFADGMTEALISSLAQIRALRVISRTSVTNFKGTQKPLLPLPEIARTLKVDGVIEGSVQRENGRVKVMIQLVHGSTDTHLWARDYERAMTDILKLQGEMARAIAEEIRIQVTPEDRTRMASSRAVNPTAHEAYLLGRFYYWKFIIDDHKRAIEHFQRSIQIDPSYAPAYAGLSMAWQMLGVQQKGLKEVETPARTALQKALELDNRLAEAYVAQGHLQLFCDWAWKGGENAFRRALELEPNSLDAHYNYAVLLMALGRFPEAIAEIQSAEQLDPLSHQVQATFGRILSRAGKPNEAILRLKQAIEREPRSAMAHHFLGEVYEQLGRYSEAVEIYDKARVLRGNRPDNPPFLAILAGVYARTGKRSEAKRILAGLREDGSGLASPAAAFSTTAYAALGDRDEAFRLLFRRVEKQEDWASIFIKTDPRLASLHSDPRWSDLLRRMNFPAD